MALCAQEQKYRPDSNVTRTEATRTEAMELGWLSSIRGIERRGTACNLSEVKGQVAPVWSRRTS